MGLEVVSQYIDSCKFQAILDEQSIEGLSTDQAQSILDRAEGDLESELCERYVVPLVSESGDEFGNCQKFATQKVLNALYAKIRSILGKDKDRNIVVDATQRYIDLHGNDFKAHIKDLLNEKKHYGFKLNSFSQDSFDPVQSLGLSRADNSFSVSYDPDVPVV